MPEHTSRWRVSDPENYEALRAEARRSIADSLVALRSGASTESGTEQAIRGIRDGLFDRRWSTSRDTGSGVES